MYEKRFGDFDSYNIKVQERVYTQLNKSFNWVDNMYYELIKNIKNELI